MEMRTINARLQLDAFARLIAKQMEIWGSQQELDSDDIIESPLTLSLLPSLEDSVSKYPAIRPFHTLSLLTPPSLSLLDPTR